MRTDLVKTILISLLVTTAHAEIITDGTLGTRVNLPGPNFQIEAHLGQQFGSNLFHSFQDFNLQSHESATFSGPNSVQNIISRVTGGNSSNIDGLIRSTIPNADVYLLNPYGIMFGPHAKLDVQGGFHASTADYLRLQDGGRFEARIPGNSLLTVAPVAAFGFLTDTPATITTQDSILTVPPFKPLSFIGGNLHLRGSFPIQFDDQSMSVMFVSSLLQTIGGPLHLVAVGSAGEVQVDNPDFTLTGRGGEIRLDHTLVDTSGPGSGNLKVRGSRLWMQDSTLQANTFGEMDGGLMDIQLTESLYASSEPYYFSAFYSDALGRGKGGSLLIKAPEVTLNRVYMSVNPLVDAVGGNTDLEVNRLSLLEGAAIVNSAFDGKAGDLTIKATESILITGQSIGSRLLPGAVITDFPSFIDSTAYPEASQGGQINLVTSRLDLVGGGISSATLGSGDAGNVVIQADNINLTAGGYIFTSAMASGLAGKISLTATETLSLSGHRTDTFVVPATGQRFEQAPSSITSFSLSGSGGQIDLTARNVHLTGAWIGTTSLGLMGEKINTSSLNIQAENLLLADGTQINSSNGVFGFFGDTTLVTGNGSGGDLHIQAKHLTLSSQFPLYLTGIFSDTYSQEPGGNIEVQSESLDMVGNAAISARSHGVGNAGQINLRTHHLHLAQHSSISTAAVQGGGGNINLTGLTNLLYLDGSEITTSVASGQRSGGNITIEKPQFVVLNQSQIKAQADEGHGGNIRIVAEQFISSADSLVSASSQKGISGEVVISSPENDIGSNLVILETKSLKADQTKTLCSKRRLNEKPSRFAVTSLSGYSPSPDDEWQGSSFRVK